MVSGMLQHEHYACASHAACSELTRSVAVLHDAVKRSAINLLQTACRTQRR